MPIYIYECSNCAQHYTEEQLKNMDKDQFGEAVLFETIHSIKPTSVELAEATICPRCNSNNCVKSMIGTKIHSYVRGYGWKDKVGARRDMDLYHLDNQDPYSKHRVPGETEHIRRGLKDSGKHNPNTKIFIPNKKADSD